MIQFKLPQVQAGWADASIASGDETLTVTTSYSPRDAIRDFVDAVASLKSAAFAHCCWLQEPGEMHWQFLRTKGELVVEVISFDGVLFPGRHGPDGTTVFKAETQWLDFAQQVFGAVLSVRASLGVDGYKREWRHPFPQEAFDKLDNAIRESRQG